MERVSDSFCTFEGIPILYCNDYLVNTILYISCKNNMVNEVNWGFWLFMFLTKENLEFEFLSPFFVFTL